MLYFCGHGSYQKCVGQNFKLAMEQSTISKILTETTNIMSDHLMMEFIKFPILDEEESVIKQRFYTKYNIPGTIGAVDCTHVGIVSPAIEEPIRPGIVYLNRKGFYSLNVQMICDADLSILNCNARFPGSVHDSAIWSLSSVRRILEQKYLDNQTPSWLIGDSGYPLEPWLLTPIENAKILTQPRGATLQLRLEQEHA